MGITITWDDKDKSIIRFTFGRLWTWKEFHTAVKDYPWRKSVDYPVDIILDARATNIVPGGLMPQIQRMRTLGTDSHGLAVVVSESAFVKSMFIVATRTFPNVTRNARFVKTLEEAYALFAHERGEVIHS